MQKSTTFWWPSDERKLQSHELKSPHVIESKPLKAVSAYLVNSLKKTESAVRSHVNVGNVDIIALVHVFWTASSS